MNIDLNFKTLKNTDNINLIYLKSQNGYYYSKSSESVYELISSIENNKGNAIQYKYNSKAEEKKNRYMYRIGTFSGNKINWTEWKSKFSKIEKNEFSFNPVDRQSIINKKDTLLKARELFFSKFISKEDFYPSSSEKSIYLSTIKQMGMLKVSEGGITLSPNNIPNKKIEELIKKFPDQEEVIRTNINGIFVIPKKVTINLPLVRSKEIINKLDNPKINKMTGEVDNTITLDNTYNMSDQNGILIVETKRYEGQWLRCYTVLTIYEIAYKIENFINTNTPISTSGWTIIARMKNLEDAYKFGGAV